MTDDIVRKRRMITVAVTVQMMGQVQKTIDAHYMGKAIHVTHRVEVPTAMTRLGVYSITLHIDGADRINNTITHEFNLQLLLDMPKIWEHYVTTKINTLIERLE